MLVSFKRALVAMLTVAALAAPVVASADGAVRVALTAQRVTTANGREVLVPAEKARPGDVIEYRATYTNDGASTARQMLATLPIPAGLEYLGGSAAPATVQASLDGRSFAPVPLTRKERLADGRVVVREVPASEYRWLRWPVGSLGSKRSFAVAARARVATSDVAALAR